MSLYLKYRPKIVEELDLTGVRESLKQIIKANRVAHAYLFTGPRGAGKTSSARILARVVNCEQNQTKLAEPCNQCLACKSILEGRAMDVIEIDGASNRGIDDVRELKEKIRLAPTSLRKKVYIIDEVHMMTTEAFNALLKTLEEPPDHAMFILCTTEAHKIPETIASRCTRVLFTKASKEEMLRSLQRVVKGEKAEVELEALELLAESVDGSFRDGVKILEQVLLRGNKVDVEQVRQALGGVSGFQVQDLGEALVEGDWQAGLSEFYRLNKAGIDLNYLLVELIKFVRELVVKDQRKDLIELVYKIDETLRKLTTSPVPEILVEMLIIEWGKEDKDVSTSRPKKIVRRVVTKKEVVNKREASEVKMSSNELWQNLVKKLEGEAGNFSLGALLAKAKPRTLQGNTLIIEVEFDFHRDQIMAEKHRARIEELIGSVVGRPMRVVCEVSHQKRSSKLQTESNPDTITLEDAKAIFTT